MIQFYAPDIASDPILPEGESIHCVRVLRIKEGDMIYVTDGKGNRFKCEIVRPHPSHTEVRIVEKQSIPAERNYKIALAVAPTKNSDRLEWLVEKAVEIGIDKFILLKCGRSERKIQKTDRLKKIAVSAMKQSLSTRLPEITELMNFKDVVTSEREYSHKFFGYCSDSFPRREFVKEFKAGDDIIVMIGPEGDFSPEEVEMAVDNGFLPVTFGEKRLRTETAGVFALSAVNVINRLSE